MPVSSAGVEQDPDDFAAEAARHQWQQKSGNGPTEWPDPEPLVVAREAERPYPVDVLPPILREAVLEYEQYGQQPRPLIASSALACVALTVQGLADVARDVYLCGPISLNFLITAISGERKSSADNHFKAPILVWMNTRCDAMQNEVAAAAALLSAWEFEREGLRARIKSVRSKGSRDGVTVEELREELVKLEQAKPTEVILPKLFYEDTNAPALAIDLAKAWPSASLWSDEGGLIVGAHGLSDDVAMGYMALLNRLWDAKPFTRDRSSAQRARIHGRRFTVSLMMQPIVVARLLSLAGGASRGMGLMARFLMTWPTSTIGTRMYRRAETMPAIARLHDRLKQLLDLPLPLDPETPTPMALAPPILRFNAYAQRLWEQFHDDVEAELGRDGEYGEVADIGAKIAENAARLAGVFHILMHGPVGVIDRKAIYRAIKVVSWHLHEARRVLAAFDQPQGISDAEILLAWLLRQPPTSIEPRRILQYGPRALGKDIKRRDTAIEILVAHQYLFPIPPASGNGAKRYILNPRARATS
jgi:hypothetical protein